MSIDIGPVDTNISVPGGLAWRRTWLVFCNDTGHGAVVAPDYTLRIYTTIGDSVWKSIDPDGVVTLKSGVVYSYALPTDTRSVSITRVATGTPPAAYAGTLSCVLERP